MREAGELHPDSETSLLGRHFDYRSVVVIDPVILAAGPGDAAAEPPAHIECRLTGLASTETDNPGLTTCPLLRVRVDQGHDLAVIDRPSGYNFAPVFAFRPSSGERVGISPVTVADHIGPPIGWTFGAGLGGVLGAAFLLAGRRVRRRAAAVDGIEGEHLGDGAVVLLAGDRILVDAAAALPIGAVVLEGAQHQLPSYRQMGLATFASARAGSLSELRMAHVDLAASLYGIAIAAAVLGATPLVIARAIGAF